MSILKLAIIGALAGFANGFFGSGGGLFLVPLFIYWLKFEEKNAFATSVAVVLPISIASIIIYYLKGGVAFQTALPYVLGGAVGGFISGKIFKKIPTTLLRRAFGVLILYGGIRAVFK